MQGSMLGHYRLLHSIGQGGMGVVWRARDTIKERDVALKLLLTSSVASRAARGDAVIRFKREAASAARLTHPHILPIFNYGEIEGRLYIEMPLVDGRDLDRLLAEEGPLPPRRAVRLVEQIADALDDAHDAKLLHRDVKPKNVLVTTRDGYDIAYLIDFGIVQQIHADRLTATGQFIGSPEYTAPERFDGKADERSDVYALALVLYTLLTDSRPFSPEDDAHWFVHNYWDAHQHRPVPAASHRCAGVNILMDLVIARGAAKDPTMRFATAGALARAARAALGPVSGGAAVLVPTAADLLGVVEGLTARFPRRDTAVIATLEEQLRTAPDPSDSFETRRRLAELTGLAGDAHGAVRNLEKLLSEGSGASQRTQYVTLSARRSLAYWLDQAGDRFGAVRVAEQLLSDALHDLGPDHRETLSARRPLADLRGRAGDLHGAVGAIEQLLADQLRIQGPGHTDVAVIRRDLAHWRGLSGDPSGAVDDLQRAVEAMTTRQPPAGSTELTVARCELAHWRGEAEGPGRAVTDLDRIMAERPVDAKRADVRRLVAHWRGRAGDPRWAVRELEAILDGADHSGTPEAVRTRHVLAYWRGAGGDLVGAVADLQRLHQEDVDSVGVDHPETVRTRHRLVHWLAERERGRNRRQDATTEDSPDDWFRPPGEP